MASIYRRNRSYPVPEGAEIIERKRKATAAELRQAPTRKTIIERFVKFTDRKGKRRRERLNEMGDKMLVPSRTYTIAYLDENGEPKEVNSKTPDRDTAQQLANHLENEAMKRRTGQIDPMLERFAQQARRPIAEHVAEFRASLEAKDNTPKHVETTDQRVRFIVEKCGATHIKHLMASAVQQAVKGIRDAGRSLETCNSYLRAIKSFTRWLWRDKRTADDALATLESYNAATDPRHPRRDLTPGELVYLLPFVEGHTKPAHNLAGPDRAMVYRLALGTGFRANELRSLMPESFDLDADPPTVTVAAAYSKRRRNDVQPIRADLADLLRPWLVERPRGKRLFLRLPRYTARMLKKDLAAARKKWIDDAKTDDEKERREKSDFLRYQDSDGRFADFHSTRHTYVSGIVAGGASVKEAQELARHSDPRLTIGRYSHARLHDLTGALEALPDLQPKAPATDRQALRATGTEGNDSKLPVNRQCANGKKGLETAKRGKQAESDEDEKTSDCAVNGTRPNVLQLRDLATEKPRPARRGNKAEGTGFEPATPYGAPHFQ